MASEYGSDFITITDEEGREYVLEHVDTIELDGVYYVSFFPTDVDEDSDEFGLLILKQEEGDDGELYFVHPEDDELDRAYEEFMKRLEEYEE